MRFVSLASELWSGIDIWDSAGFGTSHRGVFKAAQVALLHVAAQGGGATLFDDLHDPAMLKR